MPIHGRNFDGFVAPQSVIRILQVTPSETDHAFLRSILQHPNWQVHRVQNCSDASAFILRFPLSVVLSEAILPDGGWKEILEQTRHSLDVPNLVVTSRLADDRLWAEVLNLGGWDVLSTPFETAELLRVLFAASASRLWLRHQADSAVSLALEPHRLLATAG